MARGNITTRICRRSRKEEQGADEKPVNVIVEDHDCRAGK